MRRKERHSTTELASNWIMGACSTAFPIACIVFGLILLYWAFIIFSGQLKTAAPSGVGLISGMGHVLTLAAVVATGSFVVLAVEEVALILIPAGVGVALFLGIPALVVGQVGPKPNEAAQALINAGAMAGKAMLVVVALRVVYEIYRSQAEAGVRKEAAAKETAAADRKKGVKVVTGEKIFAKCWEMPFCHEAVREMCPAYKEKKSCWRYGRGCNCDADLIDTLVLSRHVGPSKKARDVESEYIRTELEVDTVRHRSEKTIPCSKCPIYGEHQRRKFRVVNPILIAISVAGIAASYTLVAGFYSSIANHVAALASGAALNQQNAANIEYWRGYLNTPALQTAFVIIIGVFVLSYMLKFGEWLVLEKKIL